MRTQELSGKIHLIFVRTRANTEAQTVNITFRNLRAGHVGSFKSQTTDTNTIFQSPLFRLETATVFGIQRTLKRDARDVLDVRAVAENKPRRVDGAESKTQRMMRRITKRIEQNECTDAECQVV